MKRKLYFGIVIVLGMFLLSTCNITFKGFGTIIGTLNWSVETFFYNSENMNQRSARNTGGSGTGNVIEFFVKELSIACDTDDVYVFLIGDHDSITGTSAGWYDIDGINRTRLYTGNRNAAPHSSIMLSIGGIRINDNHIDFGDGHINIVAGDPTKQFGYNDDAVTTSPDGGPPLPWGGVSNFLAEVSTFIVVVDEEKLHTDGVLNPSWWECFSFVTLP